MAKNTYKHNDTIKHFENILTDLNYSFNKLSFDNDDDINYDVSINTTGFLSKLQSINVLIYLNFSSYSIHILIGNIYRFDQNEDMNPFYKKVNDANEIISGGSFTVNERLRQILYSSSIYCGNEFSELSVNKVKLLIDSAMNNLIVLLNIIAGN